MNSLHGICDADYNLEVEEGMWETSLRRCGASNSQTVCIQDRSNASNYQAVHVATDGLSGYYTISSPSHCNFNIIKVLYSNDGPTDAISVYLDNDIIGRFYTSSNSGHGGESWNIFNTSGLIGNTQDIAPGEHRLKIVVTATDLHGVELDKMEVSFRMCENDCPIVDPSSILMQPPTDENVNEKNGSKHKTETPKTMILGGVLGSIILLLVGSILLVVGISHFRQRRYRNLQDTDNIDGDPNQR